MSVFQELLSSIKRALAVIRFGLLTLRYAGPKVALRKLGHQIYGSTIFLYYVREHKETRVSPITFPLRTVLASEEDLKEFFEQANRESNDGKYQILTRKWYHERGFGTPYVHKTLDTDEICGIQWLVTDKDIERAGFKGRFPELKENECLIENAYTLERFRGKGIQASSKMREIMLSMGLIWMKGFVAEDNIPALRLLKRLEGKIFERVLERHILFRVSRKTLERYDPPVPFTVPGE